MDPYRLPRSVVPLRYDLTLEPDLGNSKFKGSQTVSIKVNERVKDIVLNAADLSIESAALLLGRNTLEAAAEIRMDAATERCHLVFKNTIEPGTWPLQMKFQGTLNDKLRGFYKSSYKTSSNETRFIAVTQFEATDARRAFPCWDEPSFKAVFSTTLVVDSKLTAISNTAVAEERVEGAKKHLRFNDTIKMSTYLVAFVVGEFESTDPVYVGETPLRVWCAPGKKRLAEVGLEIGAYSLHFFEKYYGRKYPGDKLDLIAIPDFSAGAMENLGAITFRETALLVDKNATTHNELERVAVVVSHENAHMWFGDLVTMSWWNGLWLNEAFATFMEILAVDSFKPEWQSWVAFGVSKAEAMLVDGLQSTRPIEFPVAAPRDADAMFDVLTYEKGASVLRMLQQFLGSDVFQQGVRSYLSRHAYENTETNDLWVALGEASRQPIPEVMEGWIFHPGYPLISARHENGKLILSQQRFTYLKTNDEIKKQRWQIPIQVRVLSKSSHKEVVQKVLLKGEEISLDVREDFAAAVVNEGGHGFYRVSYSAELLQGLMSQANRLSGIERLNIVNDAWAAVRAGLTPLSFYLDLTARFRDETDKHVWTVLVESFQTLNAIIDDKDRADLEAFVRDRVQKAYKHLGDTPVAGENELTAQLRADLMRTMAGIGNDKAAQEKARGIYESHLKNPEAADGNLVAAAISVMARLGDASRYEEFVKKFRTASTPQEEQRYMYALAGFRVPALVEQTLSRTISGDFRTQDAPFVVRALLGSVHGRDTAWKFLKANWDKMIQLYPSAGFRRMCQGLTGLLRPELEREVLDFCAQKKVTLGGKVLDQILEQLRVGVQLREREKENLSRYLSR